MHSLNQCSSEHRISLYHDIPEILWNMFIAACVLLWQQGKVLSSTCIYFTCDKVVDFPKSGHILHLLYVLHINNNSNAGRPLNIHLPMYVQKLKNNVFGLLQCMHAVTTLHITANVLYSLKKLQAQTHSMVRRSMEKQLQLHYIILDTDISLNS